MATYVQTRPTFISGIQATFLATAAVAVRQQQVVAFSISNLDRRPLSSDSNGDVQHLAQAMYCCSQDNRDYFHNCSAFVLEMARVLCKVETQNSFKYI
jgi:hypothetical protein